MGAKATFLENYFVERNPFSTVLFILAAVALFRYAVPRISSLRPFARYTERPLFGRLLLLLFIIAISLWVVFEEYFRIYRCAVSLNYYHENIAIALRIVNLMATLPHIPFWLESATLLAQLRRQEVNAWDHDSDFSLVHPDYVDKPAEYGTVEKWKKSGTFPHATPEVSPKMADFIALLKENGFDTDFSPPRMLLQLRFHANAKPHADMWLWIPELQPDGKSIVYISPEVTVNYDHRDQEDLFPLRNVTWMKTPVNIPQRFHRVAQKEFAKYSGSYMVAQVQRHDCVHNMFNLRWMY